MGTSEFNAGGNRACDGVASHRAGGGRGVKYCQSLHATETGFFPRSAEKSSRKKYSRKNFIRENLLYWRNYTYKYHKYNLVASISHVKVRCNCDGVTLVTGLLCCTSLYIVSLVNCMLFKSNTFLIQFQLNLNLFEQNFSHVGLKVLLRRMSPLKRTP